MSDEKTTAEPSGASGGSLANYPAIPDSCLRGSTVEQRFCEPPVAGSTPAAGLYVQWITVSERLPEGGAIVLWAIEVYGRRRWIFKIGHSEGDNIFADDGVVYWITELTHWMPLPATPTDAK